MKRIVLSQTKKAVITVEQISEFAGIVGDFNPVHIDAQKAAQTRFGGIISHGMLSMGYVQSLLHGYTINCMQIKFMRPVMPGDEIEVKVELWEGKEMWSSIRKNGGEVVTEISGKWDYVI